MRLLITGDSKWLDSKYVENLFASFYKLYPKWEKFVILNCGCSKGVDADAREIARKYKLESITFKSNFEKYKRTAFLLRNTDIIQKGKPNLIWVIYKNNIEASGSLQDLIQKAKKKKIPINIFPEESLCYQKNH